MHITCIEKNGFGAMGRIFPVGGTEIEIREHSAEELARVATAHAETPAGTKQARIDEVRAAREWHSSFFVFTPAEAVRLREHAALRPQPAGRLIAVGRWPKEVDAAERERDRARAAGIAKHQAARTDAAVARARNVTAPAPAQ